MAMQMFKWLVQEPPNYVCLQLEETAAMAKVAGLMGRIKALHEQVQQVEVSHCCWLQLLQGQTRWTWSCHILLQR